jgi:hypothetical protein
MWAPSPLGRPATAAMGPCKRARSNRLGWRWIFSARNAEVFFLTQADQKCKRTAVNGKGSVAIQIKKIDLPNLFRQYIEPVWFVSVTAPPCIARFSRRQPPIITIIALGRPHNPVPRFKAVPGKETVLPCRKLLN